MSSDYSFDQIGQLVFSLRRNGWTKEDVTKLGQCGEEKSRSIRAFLSGEVDFVSKTKSVELEPVIDSLIRVDRSVKPVYPDWVKKVMHPKLEKTGPAEYDISQVELWLHEGQKNGKWVMGQVIYEYLKKEKMLESCLSLRDLEEIQKKGIAFFRKHFQGKAMFAWKSVVLDRDGHLRAPFLYEGGGEVVLHWYWLEYVWNDDYPALWFAS